MQNLAPGANLAPHFLHFSSALICAPHSGQNLTLAGSGASHFGQVARAPSRQLSSFNIARSSSAIWECAQISSTVRLDWAAAISTPKSGEHCLQSPFFEFQQSLLQTQEEQRGHWIKLGFNSSIAARKASSCAFCQVAERARSPRLAACPITPPNRLLAASKTDETVPMAKLMNRVR